MIQYQAITTCRVSSDEQLKNHSLETQARKVMAKAKELGVTIPKDGQWSLSVSSKRGNNYKRKDLHEMLDYCKKRKLVKYLIVSEPDRFMRSIEEACYWIVSFKAIGVEVVFADEEGTGGKDVGSKLIRLLKFATAEGSNEERQRKAISGGETAILQGRYPYSPKLGYHKGKEIGVHELAPEIGELMRNLLTRLANGTLGLSESLKEFNESHFVKSGKHCPYRLDHWRKIVSDSYYAGVVEIHKQVDARNEHGLHEKLITMEQHYKILEIVNNKVKAHSGPRKNGNPDFPLNAVTLCKKCSLEEAKFGRIGKRNRGKFVGYKNKNGHSEKIYEHYKCRKCGRLVTKEKMHRNFSEFLDDLTFTKCGCNMLKAQLHSIWKTQKDDVEKDVKSLERSLAEIEKFKEQLVDKLVRSTNEAVTRELENQLEHKTNEITDLQQKISMKKADYEYDYYDFVDFAVDFANNLAKKFLELSPADVKRCKLLLFPDGFLVNDDFKVYTNKISPLYRLQETKNGPKGQKNVNLVPPEGLEPTTFCSEDRRSNPLSYGGIFGMPDTIRFEERIGDAAYWIWYARHDSNVRPSVPETDALSS